MSPLSSFFFGSAWVKKESKRTYAIPIKIHIRARQIIRCMFFRPEISLFALRIFSESDFVWIAPEVMGEKLSIETVWPDLFITLMPLSTSMAS